MSYPLHISQKKIKIYLIYNIIERVKIEIEDCDGKRYQFDERKYRKDEIREIYPEFESIEYQTNRGWK